MHKTIKYSKISKLNMSLEIIADDIRQYKIKGGILDEETVLVVGAGFNGGYIDGTTGSTSR